MDSRCPRKRSSRTTTLSPFARSSSTVTLPMYPAPPVTRIAMISFRTCGAAISSPFARAKKRSSRPNCAQALRCLLRSQIALRAAQHLETNHKFPYCRRTQQRRIKMRVQMPLGMRSIIGRTLVKAHRIRKWRVEQMIVTRSKFLQHVGERIAFRRRQLVERARVPLGDNHRFERPNRPERNERDEVFVLFNDALARFFFLFQVIAQKT